MKKLLFPLLPFIALAVACKKDSHVNIDEVRLQTMKTTDSSGKISALNFQYDQQGRIISFTSSASNGTVTDLASVSYSGNEITVTYILPQSPSFYSSTVVWYKLNSNNVPDRRIETDIENENDISTQKTTQTDTTDYIYDASGLLTKATGSFFDTTWYDDRNLGFPQIETYRTKYTRDYTNSNNTMTKVVINKTEAFTVSRSGTTHSGNEYTDATYTFEYNHKYPNKTDFNNAVVLAEAGVIFNRDCLMNKAYAYMPDKISYTETIRYSSGNPASTNSSSSMSLTWGYNGYGFISSMNDAYKHDFIYNY
jgi:hypothetical protein